MREALRFVFSFVFSFYETETLCQIGFQVKLRGEIG